MKNSSKLSFEDFNLHFLCPIKENNTPTKLTYQFDISHNGISVRELQNCIFSTKCALRRPMTYDDQSHPPYKGLWIKLTSLRWHLDNLHGPRRTEMNLDELSWTTTELQKDKRKLEIWISEEIDSFHWPKMHLWKGAKKLDRPPPLIWTKSKKTAGFPQEPFPKGWFMFFMSNDQRMFIYTFNNSTCKVLSI